MTKTTVTTIRLPIALAEKLEVVARVEGLPMSEVIRTAIVEHIAERRADPEFQRRVRERLEADRAILERLAGDSITANAKRPIEPAENGSHAAPAGADQ